MIKKIFYIISICLLSQTLFAAGDGGGSSSEPDLYKEAERLEVLRKCNCEEFEELSKLVQSN